MGTSTHNRGQNGRTPLVPSWLEQPDNDIQIPPDGDADRHSLCGAGRRGRVLPVVGL